MVRDIFAVVVSVSFEDVGCSMQDVVLVIVVWLLMGEFRQANPTYVQRGCIYDVAKDLT